ncbi:MAG: hypothetical protein JRJ02_08900 [Deltaproteobacteria bacterium]|nr:hypothetical protein [Deltaproteobacteria bacterium]
MPGCQVTSTVFGREGNLLVLNKQWTGPDGIRGMDTAPVQPHTAARTARSCPSCHANPKALGYGIEDGRCQKNDTNIVIDLKDPDGLVIPRNAKMDKMERKGVCFGCHQLMDNKRFWSKLAEPGYLTDQEHLELMKKAVEAFADRLSKP